MKTWTYQFQLGRNQPKTTITGNTFDECFSKTKDFFIQRGININSESIALQIKRANSGPLTGRRLSIRESIAGAQALLKLATGKVASNEEIIRRASICSACPKLDTTSDCMACGGAKRVAEILTVIRNSYGSDVKVPPNVKSKYCGVCGCSMALKIITRFGSNFTENKQHQDERPQFCWLKQGSKNYTQE